MHELAITMNVLEIALRHAENAERIGAVHLVIGQLSSMVDDSVQFYWDIISKGTKAEGSTLVFKRIPAVLECQTCYTQYPIASRLDFTCPTCGGITVKVIAGEEFYVDSIEVEGLTNDDQHPRVGEDSQRE
jgi:hydrogenase nickel incorporation protein HypA/HybF